MILTPAQNAIIKADIAANGDLNAQPLTQDGADAIASLYNLPAVPAFAVWQTAASVPAVHDAIEFAKYTPVDVADGTVLQTNRLMAIQTKQMNLQTMTQGRLTVDASKANVRAGLRDAVIAIPAGTNGAQVTAGGVSGVNVMTALIRPSTRLEQLLITSSPTTGGVTAGVMGAEGSVGYAEIVAARV